MTKVPVSYLRSSFLLFTQSRSTDRYDSQKSTRPCILKIETTRDRIDIKHFSYQKQIRQNLTFKGFKINFRQLYSTSRDKFLLECTLAPDFKTSPHQHRRQLLFLFLGKIRPICIRTDSTVKHMTLPQSFGQMKHRLFHDRKTPLGFPHQF